MRTLIAIFLVGSIALGQAGPEGKKKERALDIQLEGEWEANKKTTHAILLSCANDLWQHFPNRRLKTVKVSAKGGPITWFKRGAKGEYTIKLNTGKTYWAQHVFQFAHEMCHVLSNYDDDPHKQGWFEETLCETASLHVLRSQAKVWKKKPPYKGAEKYAKHLKSYADQRIKGAPLPKNKTLAQWYNDNLAELEKSSTNRPLNNVAAVQLLPLFEKDPESWEAITWVNTEKLTKAHTFRDFLEAWRWNAPKKHHEFIGKIAKEFGITLDK